MFAVAVAIDMTDSDFLFADQFRMRYVGADKRDTVADLLEDASRRVSA
jgi:hypothetical protein